MNDHKVTAHYVGWYTDEGSGTAEFAIRNRIKRLEECGISYERTGLTLTFTEPSGLIGEDHVTLIYADAADL